jgi:hypothetical protein
MMSRWGDVSRVHGFIKSMCEFDGGVVIATERSLFLLKDGKLSKLEFDLTFDMSDEKPDY